MHSAAAAAVLASMPTSAIQRSLLGCKPACHAALGIPKPCLQALTYSAGWCSRTPYLTLSACRYYVAELVKLYPLLAAAWGVLLFRELRGLGRKAALLLASMCGAYLLGVLLLAFARNHSGV